MYCVVCGEEITDKASHPTKKYCSTKCASKAYGERYWANRPKWRKSATTGTVGAVHEIQVSADLLKRGYNVFRSLSPSCPCDLICMKDGVVLRVEVTTGEMTKAGNLSHTKMSIAKTWDILAVVVNDEINYVPELD